MLQLTRLSETENAVVPADSIQDHSCIRITKAANDRRYHKPLRLVGLIKKAAKRLCEGGKRHA